MLKEAFQVLDHSGFQETSHEHMERIRSDAGETRERDRGATETTPGTRGNDTDDEDAVQRNDGIDYDEVITNAARYMGVFDIELVYSWTPREYELLMKGVHHQEIDRYDFMAQSALAREAAHRAKRMRPN
ncbi:hypothetical protein D7Z54_35230, partial [Salibacterium salarium]